MASSLLLISTEAPAIRSTDQFCLFSLGLLGWEHIWEHIWEPWQAEDSALSPWAAALRLKPCSNPATPAPGPSQTFLCHESDLKTLALWSSIKVLFPVYDFDR